VYSVYLLYMQTVRGSEYRTQATRISQQSSIIPSQRGEIYDRSYSVPFALNTDSFAIDLVPAELPADRRESVFSSLSMLLSIPVDDIRKKVPPANYRLYQPIEILGSISYATVSVLAERIDEFSRYFLAFEAGSQLPREGIALAHSRLRGRNHERRAEASL